MVIMRQGQVDWDDPTIQANQPNSGNYSKAEKFVAKPGKLERICIVDKKATSGFTHFVQSYGTATCLGTPDCPLCKIKAPDQKFVANILVYETDETGVTYEPINFVIKQLSIGPSIFDKIRSIKSKWGDLNKYDLEVACTNPKFQHLNITPFPDALYLKDADAKAVFDKLSKEGLYDTRKYFPIYTKEELQRILTGDLNQTNKKEVLKEAYKRLASQQTPQPTQRAQSAQPVSQPVQATAQPSQQTSQAIAQQAAQTTQRKQTVQRQPPQPVQAPVEQMVDLNSFINDMNDI